VNPPLKTSMSGPEPEAVLPPPTPPPPPPLPGPAGAHAGLGRVSPSASLDCPRCDQDLRAEPMGWTISCPLEGRCPECGLSFRWADQLSRRHALPRWSLEGAAGAREWFRRWPGQVAMAIGRPGQVHRRLRDTDIPELAPGPRAG